MARKVREERLLGAVEDAVSDSRFSKHLWAQQASMSPQRKEIFQLFSAFIEMLAISGDFGNFDYRDAEEVLLSRRVRDTIHESIAERDGMV